MKAKTDQQEIVFTWKMFFVSFSLLIGMSPLFLYIAYRNNQRKSIRQHQAFTTGIITKLTYNVSKRGPMYATLVSYWVNDRSYACKGTASGLITAKQRDSLVGIQLPVIYEKGNPSNSCVLSSDRTFNRFDLDLPDSLAWTKLYFTD